MEKNITERIKELANQVLQLSIDVACMKKQTTNSEDADDIQKMSDELFHIQSEMRYEYYPLAQDIWGD